MSAEAEVEVEVINDEMFRVVSIATLLVGLGGRGGNDKQGYVTVCYDTEN